MKKKIPTTILASFSFDTSSVCLKISNNNLVKFYEDSGFNSLGYGEIWATVKHLQKKAFSAAFIEEFNNLKNDWDCQIEIDMLTDAVNEVFQHITDIEYSKEESKPGFSKILEFHYEKESV